MSDSRKRGLDSFVKTGLDPVLVRRVDLPKWIVEGAPLHPAFDLLHATHQSDYLRAYFMHHHGGGYADIKPQTESWLPAVDRVRASPHLLATGYREVRGGTVLIERQAVQGRTFLHDRPVPRVMAGLLSYSMRVARPLLIGNGAFYFKPGTDITRRWIEAVNSRLDFLQTEIAANPPRGPQDKAEDGHGYPVPWAWIMGAVLAPLAFRYMHRIDRSLPVPTFRNYR